MSEIEVVVDVRQSPDSPELIVVKRKLAINGTVQLVGDPAEQRFELSAHSVPVPLDAVRAGDKLKVNRRAKIPLDTLSEPEKQALLQAVASLPGTDPARWPPDKVKPLATSGTPTYLLYVSPELRAFITPADNGGIELLDLVHRDTLKLFQDDEPEAAVQG